MAEYTVLQATLVQALRDLATSHPLQPRDRAFWEAVHRGTGAILSGGSPDKVQRGMLQIAAAIEGYKMDATE